MCEHCVDNAHQEHQEDLLEQIHHFLVEELIGLQLIQLSGSGAEGGGTAVTDRRPITIRMIIGRGVAAWPGLSTQDDHMCAA